MFKVSGTITTSGTSNPSAHVDYKITCIKCSGTGFQQRNDGVYVVCPICDGKGYRDVRDDQGREPTPYYPWYPMPWRDQPTYIEPHEKYIITC